MKELKNLGQDVAVKFSETPESKTVGMVVSVGVEAECVDEAADETAVEAAAEADVLLWCFVVVAAAEVAEADASADLEAFRRSCRA